MNANIFWMVYGLHQNAPVRRHKTAQSALAEARRLARQHPDVDFYVLEPKHRVVKHDVEVTTLIGGEWRLPTRDLDDDIPF